MEALMEQLFRKLDVLKEEIHAAFSTLSMDLKIITQDEQKQQKKKKLKLENKFHPYWILKKKKFGSKTGGRIQKCGPKSGWGVGKFKVKQNSSNLKAGWKNMCREPQMLNQKIDFNWKKIMKTGKTMATWMPSELVKLKVMFLLD